MARTQQETFRRPSRNGHPEAPVRWGRVLLYTIVLLIVWGLLSFAVSRLSDLPVEPNSAVFAVVCAFAWERIEAWRG